MGKKIVLASAVIALPLGVYALTLAFSPLPVSVIDRDHSGIISLGETLGATDIGQRQSKRGPGCIEYFWLKDGLPAYEHCSS
jgi:hypothetical protein